MSESIWRGASARPRSSELALYAALRRELPRFTAEASGQISGEPYSIVIEMPGLGATALTLRLAQAAPARRAGRRLLACEIDAVIGTPRGRREFRLAAEIDVATKSVTSLRTIS
jgi:hypothetical protein